MTKPLNKLVGIQPAIETINNFVDNFFELLRNNPESITSKDWNVFESLELLKSDIEYITNKI